MKYDPESKVRSQRENMQAFQLRLPKEVIRDLQILRVFAGIKVSEELRDLVCAWVDGRRELIHKAAHDATGDGYLTTAKLEDVDARDAAHALSKAGEVEILSTTVGETISVEHDEQGNRVVKSTRGPDYGKKETIAVRKRPDKK